MFRWTWDGGLKPRYPAFIAHMREAFDPGYFRTMRAVEQRLSILMSRKSSGARFAGSEESEMEESSECSEREDGDAEAMEDTSDDSYEPTPRRPASKSAKAVEGIIETVHKRSAMTSNMHKRATRVTSESLLVVIGSGSSSDEADASHNKAKPDVVPTSAPTIGQGLAARKLRRIQAVSGLSGVHRWFHTFAID